MDNFKILIYKYFLDPNIENIRSNNRIDDFYFNPYEFIDILYQIRYYGPTNKIIYNKLDHNVDEILLYISSDIIRITLQHDFLTTKYICYTKNKPINQFLFYILHVFRNIGILLIMNKINKINV